jgi:hypothetical protein
MMAIARNSLLETDLGPRNSASRDLDPAYPSEDSAEMVKTLLAAATAAAIPADLSEQLGILLSETPGVRLINTPTLDHTSGDKRNNTMSSSDDEVTLPPPVVFASIPADLLGSLELSTLATSGVSSDATSTLNHTARYDKKDAVPASDDETMINSLAAINTRKRRFANDDDNTTSFHLPEPSRKKRCKKVSFQNENELPQTIDDVIEVENANNLLGNDLDSWEAHFSDASEEVKNALRYLSHAQIKYVSAYLEYDRKDYGKNLRTVAKVYRETVALYHSAPLPDADELKCLKKELLEFLAMHLNYVVVCHDCEAVHRLDVHSECASSVVVCAHDQLNSNGRIAGAASENSFWEASYVMKNFFCGSCAYGKIWAHRFCQDRLNWISEEACDLYLAEPYITDDERLLIRHQHWFVINHACKNPEKRVPTFMHWDLVDSNILCRHVLQKNFSEQEFFDWSTMTKTMTEPHRCGQCAMEFQVDTTELGATGWAVVLTAWRDMGRCRSIWDPRWQAHFANYGERRFILNYGRTRRKSEFSLPDELDDMLIDPMDEELDNMERGWREDEEDEVSDWELGGIRDAFEGGAGMFDLQDCMDEERLLAFIRKRAERVVITEISRGKSAGSSKWKLLCMAELPQWGGFELEESEEVMRIRYTKTLRDAERKKKRKAELEVELKKETSSD